MTRPRPDVDVAGYSVAARFARVYLVNQFPGSDPGMTCTEARVLARALLEAADRAERMVRPKAQEVRT
jgi:hypothetical protein